MRIKNFLLTLSAIGLVAAYAPAVSAQEESAAIVAQDSDIKVVVVNRNWLDVRVYAVSGSHSVRLGTVTGFGEQTFTLPRSIQAGYTDLMLAVRPIGQRGVHYSMPLLASPGDIIEFRVENHLALSSAIVY